MSSFSEMVEQAYYVASKQVDGKRIWLIGMDTSIEQPGAKDPCKELGFYLRFHKDPQALEGISARVTAPHPSGIFSRAEFGKIIAFAGVPKELDVTVMYAQQVKPGLQLTMKMKMPGQAVAQAEDDELFDGEILELDMKKGGVYGEKTLKKLNRFPPIDYAKLGKYLKTDLTRSCERQAAFSLGEMDLTGLYDAYSWLNMQGKGLRAYVTGQDDSRVMISTVREPKGIYSNVFDLEYEENGWNISRGQVDYLEAVLEDLIGMDAANCKYQIRAIRCHTDKSWLKSAMEQPPEDFIDFLNLATWYIEGTGYEKYITYHLEKPLPVELGR